MKEDTHIEIDESLLSRYLDGTAEKEEADTVQKWIEASEDNRKRAKEIHYITFASDTLRNLRKNTPDRALGRVKKRIGQKRRRFIFQRFQRIAAILILPLFLLSGYFLYREYRQRPVEYMEIRMNPGMIGSLSLPDGSKVWLNSGSYLRYPTRFADATREVMLDGEAYFSVVTDPGKKFIVHAEKDQVKMEVLGTEFNMDAYQANNRVTASLVSGSVRLTYLDQSHEERSLLMKPDDKVVYDKENGTISKKQSEVNHDIVWREGTIILRNTPLRDVLWTLSKRFDVDFEIGDKRLEASSFTGTFKNQQLERILEHFKIASGIRYTINQEMGENDEIKKKRVTLY